MFKIRTTQKFKYVVVITELIEGDLITREETREAQQGRMMIVEDVPAETEDDYVVHLTASERTLFPKNLTEINNWEPDNTMKVGTCCNHGG
jgi:hypothetical protein